MFEWFLARLVYENGCQGDMCYDEIGLCVQNVKYHSQFNIFIYKGRNCIHLSHIGLKWLVFLTEIPYFIGRCGSARIKEQTS